MSKIEWTEKTWNPTIGCSKASEGCKNCYAIKEAWIRMGNPNPKIQQKFAGTVMKTPGGDLNWTGDINLGQDALTIPLRTKKPALWFVNSMSDLFHPNMPQEWIDEVMAVMALCRQHTFQVLTKHPEEMLAYFKTDWTWRVADKLNDVYGAKGGEMFKLAQEVQQELVPLKNGFLPNLWLGVSVESQKWADIRIPLLLKVPAAVRFLSCEPLLSNLSIENYLNGKRFCNKCGFHGYNYTKYAAIEGVHEGCNYSAYPSKMNDAINWVIAGGESGPDARPMHPTWIQALREQCLAAGVPYFFKQWGDWMPINEWAEAGGHKKTCVYKDGFFDEHMYVRNGESGQPMAKVGKKKAGAEVDFVMWREMPAGRETVVSS